MYTIFQYHNINNNEIEKKLFQRNRKILQNNLKYIGYTVNHQLPFADVSYLIRRLPSFQLFPHKGIETDTYFKLHQPSKIETINDIYFRMKFTK